MNARLVRALTSRLPLPRGTRRATGLLRRLHAPAPPDVWIEIPAPPIGRLTLNLASHGLWEPYYFTGAFVRRFIRSPLAALMRSELEPGDIFVDVGANLGLYSILAARVQPECAVLAVEPEPGTFEALSRNVRLNGTAGIRCFELALADSRGQVRLGINRSNYGGHSIVGRGRTYARHVDVECDTLTHWIRGVGGVDPRAVRLIKVDVEGAEAAVVTGMVEFLRTTAFRRPPLIHCEVRGPESRRAASSAVVVADILAALNYRPTIASPRGTLRPADPAAARGIVDLTFIRSDDPLLGDHDRQQHDR